MVSFAGHGGHCCGLRHIFSFSATEERNPDNINIELVRSNQYGRATEVVLTDNQCRNYPNILQRLADLGFVLAGRFMNDNSDNICNVFHRMDHRKAITATALPYTWNGQKMHPELAGDLSSSRAAGSAATSHATFLDPASNPTQAPARPRTAPANRQEAPRVVVSLFHNVYPRAGRSDIAFSTKVAADRKATDRRVRCDRHDYLSDGTSVWVENV